MEHQPAEHKPAMPSRGDLVDQNVIEIRNAAAARRFVAQSMWLQRAAVPAAETVAVALECAIAISSSGEPLPPVGFIADVATLVLG
jgi:hypothetical protein